MTLNNHQVSEEFDPNFKIFHELMKNKIREILLVSSLYEACIMEEDCRLSERIINEYRGVESQSTAPFDLGLFRRTGTEKARTT